MVEIDGEQKRLFRNAGCIIAAVAVDKRIIIPKYTNLLTMTQNDKEFEDLLDEERWAVLVTTKSNIILTDLDKKKYDPKLNTLFNRTRYAYKKEDDWIWTKHGFIEVVGATHADLVRLAKKYHNKIGIEIYAEKHWVIFGGRYNSKKKDELDVDENNVTEEMPMATWSYTDDSRAVPIIKITKEKLVDILSQVPINDSNKKTNIINTTFTAPTGQGKRHDALIALAFKIKHTEIKYEKDKPAITIDKDYIYDEIIQSRLIGDVEEYRKGNSKYEELKKIIDWVWDNGENSQTFAKAFTEKQNKHYAHILDQQVKNQFNNWIWKKTYWSTNSAHEILMDLLPLESVEFHPTSGMSNEIANQTSAKENTIQVKLDDKNYNNKMMSVIINSHGQYYDLKTGEIKKVDPSEFFFMAPQVELKFEETEPPELFLEFLSERYSDKHKEILIDHLAGGFIHVDNLGAKAKILTNQGEPNTWKSIVVEIMECIFNILQYSEQSFEHVEKSNFGKSLVANKMWNFQEEMKHYRVPSMATIKEIVTAATGKAEWKGEGERYVYRWPRHLILTNKIQPISQDDNDDSIFLRNQYITSKDVPAKYDWREKLKTPEELQKIMMFLLNRAHEIYSKKSEICMQTQDETKEQYDELVEGSMRAFLKHWCITDWIPTTKCTSFSWLLSKHREVNKNKISSRAFTAELEELGFEKSKGQKWVYLTDDPNVFTEIKDDGISEDHVQKTVVSGIVPNYKTKSAVNMGIGRKVKPIAEIDGT